ncbi:MAG: DUF4430 domain-containing protein [Patescibacteria group bacterium]
MNKQIIQFASGIVIAFLLGLVVGSSSWLPSKISFPKEQKEGVAHLMIDYSDGNIATCEKYLPPSSTAFDLLKLCAEDQEKPFVFEFQDYPDLGIFIKKIGDKTGGEDNKYWEFWINHTHPEVGAGTYVLEGNEYVEWKFLKSQY